MKEFHSGIVEVIVGLIGGIVFSAVLQSFKESNLIPSNMVYLFTFIGIASSLVTLFSFWKTGIIFTLGWIFGAFLLRDALTTVDFIIYFVVPLITLIIRGIIFVRNQFN
jgi:hypothetical protein